MVNPTPSLSSTTKVLLIEDSPDDAEWIRLHLTRSKKFEVNVVNTLEDASKILGSSLIDVILLDLSLPDAHGLQALDQLQKHFSQTPIVVCSGTMDDSVALTAVKQGAQDYLIKDQITGEVLQRSVEYAINRKYIEDKLRRAHDDLNNLLSVIPSVLIGIDEEEKIYQWNFMAEMAFGLSAEQTNGQKFSSLKIDWNWQEILRALKICREEHRTVGLHYIACQRQNDTKGFFDLTIANVHTTIPDQQRCLILGVDVTERKQLEAQLSFAQKMEAIGQLAAGVAHEINTPMQFIHDNLTFLQDKFSSVMSALDTYSTFFETTDATIAKPSLSPEAQASITKIDVLKDDIPDAIQDSLEGADRVSSIVRAMKEFSHPGTTEKKLANLNNALANTITVSRNEWKYVAEIATEFDPDLPSVPCLPGELNQVFLNLIVNAAHAIADVVGKEQTQKGTITISTRTLDHAVEVHIHDTGTGIPEDIRSRIFEPFFTTKEVGKGTGQGLAMAHDVITKKHQGSIRVESVMGKGTTFIVQLPLESREPNCVGSVSSGARSQAF